MLTDSVVNQLWTENHDDFIHFIYKLRDRLSTEQFRNFFSKEEIEDLFISSIQVLLVKFLKTEKITDYVRARKLLYGIIRLEFIKVLEKKVENFYFSLGKAKYEGYLYQRRQYRAAKSRKWVAKNRKRYNFLARKSYHKHKETILKKRKTPEHRKRHREYMRRRRSKAH